MLKSAFLTQCDRALKSTVRRGKIIELGIFVLLKQIEPNLSFLSKLVNVANSVRYFSIKFRQVIRDEKAHIFGEYSHRKILQFDPNF